jgi:hypothetical protein
MDGETVAARVGGNYGMTWTGGLIVAIAGLALSLPIWLILTKQARLIAFIIRSARSPQWRERPWSPWKVVDWTKQAQDASFSNDPPQLTRPQTLMIAAVSVVLAYIVVCVFCFSVPR